MSGMKKELDNLKSSKPELALYVPNCIIHCMTYEFPEIRVDQQSIFGFLSSWLEGDGTTAQHALDGITEANPTCPPE